MKLNQLRLIFLLVYLMTLIQKNDKIKVIYYKEKGFNYSKINNFGVKSAKGDYILLLNNDTHRIYNSIQDSKINKTLSKKLPIIGI